MALTYKHNEAKHVFQMTFDPSKLDPKVNYVTELHTIAEKAQALKSSNGALKCLILINGNSGGLLSGLMPSDAFRMFSEELASLSSFVPIIDNIVVASPDTASSMLIRFIRALPGLAEVRDKITILE